MFLHADSEDSDLTGQMPRLSQSSLGVQLILLILSCGGSFFIYGFMFAVLHNTSADIRFSDQLECFWEKKKPQSIVLPCLNVDFHYKFERGWY